MKDNLDYKKQKKKQKHLLKELQTAEQGDCSSIDNWEAIDMKKQLHPIGYYINNREEMIRQVFTVIQGEKLKKMLPPVLKEMDLDELKADCLIHLVGMSSKRIKAVLEGRELDMSSDESDSDIESGISRNNKSNCNPDVSSVSNNDLGLTQKKRCVSNRSSATRSNSGQNLEDGCSIISGDDMLEIGLSNSELCDDYFESNDDSKSPKIRRKKLKRFHNQQTISTTEITDVQEIDEMQKSTSTSKKNVEIVKDVNSENNENKGKTLLEILELEMRARAIRALLQRDDSPNASSSSHSKDKQNQSGADNNDNTQGPSLSSDIIDLTSVNDSSELKTTHFTEISRNEGEADKINAVSCHESTNVTTVDIKNSSIGDNIEKEESKKEQFDEKQQENLSESEIHSIKEEINLLSSDEENICKGNDVSEMDKHSLCDKKSVPFEGGTDNDNEKITINSNNNSAVAVNSWAQRWLEKKSKDVKRLVSTSKMCTTIRNKMKKSKLNKNDNMKTSGSTEGNLQSIPSEFKGSIEEYNLLKITPGKQPTDKEEKQELCQENPDKSENIVNKEQNTNKGSDELEKCPENIIKTNESNETNDICDKTKE